MLECTKCKLKYIGKAETEFNITFNDHQKDVWKPDAIPARRHFSDKSHNFNRYTKCTLIEEQIDINIDIDKEKNKEKLKQRENLILTLETLTPKVLNQESIKNLISYFHCPNEC